MRPFRVWSRRGYAEILSSPSIAFSLEHFYVVVAPSEHKKRKSFFFSFLVSLHYGRFCAIYMSSAVWNFHPSFVY